MKIKLIQPWRWLVKSLHAVIVLGIPFLKIKGQSALRFDIPSLRLHFFGVSIWMDEFFIVLIATIFLTFLIVFITLMFGRIWCGWLCPQTVVIEFTSFIDKARKKGIAYKLISYAAVFIISAILGASLIWYFVSPYEFFSALMTGVLGNVVWGFWIVLTVITFLNFLLLRRKFCATVCPYAKLQSAMFDNKTLVIAFDPLRKEECMNCMACVRVCPVGIDIRKGLNASCVSCAECIDACTKMTSKVNKKGLIGYFFGMVPDAKSILRPNAIMIGALTLVSFAFLVYLVLTRTPIDMTVLPNHGFQPRIVMGGNIVNSYILSIDNKGEYDRTLNIIVEGGFDIQPKEVFIKAGETKKIPVFVSSRNIKDGALKGIKISIVSERPDKIRIEREANFVIPLEVK